MFKLPRLYDSSRAQRGESVIMIMGVLGILLLIVTLAIEVVHFYNSRAVVSSVAKQIASYAGTSLPNPTLACRRAFDAFQVFGTDLYDSSAKLGSEPVLKLWFELPDSSLDQDRVLSSRDDCDDPSKFTFPVGALHVQLEAPFNYETVRLLKFGENDDWTGFSVSALAIARPVPTDVVLVIENSNSVVSPHADEADNAQGESFDLPVGHPFEAWKDLYLGYRNGTNYKYRDANNANLAREMSAAQMRIRQCFGEVNYSLKLAALRAFDYLSSSNSFRVGVLHTLSPSGEFNFPTVNLTGDSYASTYTPIELSSLNSFPAEAADSEISASYFSAPPPYYGSFDNPQTRCAALAKSADGGSKYIDPEPDHPLKNIFPNDFSWSVPSNMVDASASGVTLKSGGDAAAVTFLPRDLIWIASAGISGAYNMLEPKFDFTPMQYAILRARDLLVRAPIRSDKLPVKRKVVLVFTDGFENPLVDFDPAKQGFKSAFTRISQDSDADSSNLTEQSVIKVDAEATPSVSDYIALVSNYCLASLDLGPNLIDQETQVKDDPTLASGEDLKLGILYYTNRSAWKAGDTLGRLAHVPGHDSADADDATQIDSFRKYCNTPWSYERGRFMLETNNRTNASKLGMAMAASLFSSEVVTE